MGFVAGNRIARSFLATPEKGAEQLVRLAEGVPGADWRQGAYSCRREATRPRNRRAVDADFARRFWDRFEELLAGRLPGAAR
ncbi:hypothetical protein [Streptomyces tremellae]